MLEPESFPDKIPEGNEQDDEGPYPRSDAVSLAPKYTPLGVGMESTTSFSSSERSFQIRSPL